jgi:hypothetical protein
MHSAASVLSAALRLRKLTYNDIVKRLFGVKKCHFWTQRMMKSRERQHLFIVRRSRNLRTNEWRSIPLYILSYTIHREFRAGQLI